MNLILARLGVAVFLLFDPGMASSILILISLVAFLDEAILALLWIFIALFPLVTGLVLELLLELLESTVEVTERTDLLSLPKLPNTTPSGVSPPGPLSVSQKLQAVKLLLMST